MTNTTFKITTFSLLTSASVIGLLATSPAVAQTAPQVEEIVVTAQRRSEALQNVPISITVASGKQLETAGITRMDEIGVITPGVQISRVGIFTQPSIRGITSQLAGTQYENNIPVYVDGYYIPSGRALDMDLVNISQIEVLKGPQGTLFGRNATGGAIMIQTLDPSLTTRSGKLSASYSRFHDKQFQGYFSTPFTDSFAMNIAADYRKSDDYIKDISGFNTAELNNYSFSTKLLFQPLDDLTLSAKLETMRNTDGRALAFTMEGHNLAALVKRATFTTADNQTSDTIPVHDVTYQHTASGKIEYNLGGAKLASLTSWQLERSQNAYDLDGTPVLYAQLINRDRFKTVSEDLNLTSTTKGPVQYVAGFYYFTSQADTPFYTLLFGTPNFNQQQGSFQNTKAYAGYGDVTWQVMEKLFLTGGLRYGHETRKLHVVSGANALLFDGSVHYNSATPRAVIRYQVDENSNIYASYSRGFRSGLISTAAPAFNYVAPETVNAYEIGYKTAQEHFTFNTATYFYDYKNLQVSSTQILNNINTTVTTNAAAARIYGVEAQINARVTEDFNVNAGGAYTHARYTHFPNASVSALNAFGLNSPSCPDTLHPCTQDWSGQQIARAPDWTFDVGADYTTRTSIGKLVFAGNLAYTSSYVTVKGDLLNGKFRYGDGAYALLNLRASWSPPDNDHLTLTVGGTNVTNTRYYFYRSGNATGDYHVLGQPATWSLRADYSF